MPLTDDQRDEMLCDVHEKVTMMERDVALLTQRYGDVVLPAVRETWKNRDAVRDARQAVAVTRLWGAVVLAVLTLVLAALSLR